MEQFGTRSFDNSQGSALIAGITLGSVGTPNIQSTGAAVFAPGIVSPVENLSFGSTGQGSVIYAVTPNSLFSDNNYSTTQNVTNVNPTSTGLLLNDIHNTGMLTPIATQNPTDSFATSQVVSHEAPFTSTGRSSFIDGNYNDSNLGGTTDIGTTSGGSIMPPSNTGSQTQTNWFKRALENAEKIIVNVASTCSQTIASLSQMSCTKKIIFAMTVTVGASVLLLSLTHNINFNVSNRVENNGNCIQNCQTRNDNGIQIFIGGK